MRIEALLLAGLGSLGALAPAFGQETDGQPAEAAPAAAPAAGAPSDALDADWPVAPIDPKVNVAELIAEYNAGLPTPRTFTEEERRWIATGLLAPEEVDDVYKGYAYVPSGDPNKVMYIRDGERHMIASDPEFATEPVAQNVPPFAEEVDDGTFWMAEAASDTARSVDAMFNFIMWTSYIFTAIIGILMVAFCIVYRRRPGVRADQSITHNTPIEIIWSVLPTILCAIMFWGGYTTYLDMRTPPPDAMVVKVNASQWAWNFTYPDGVESPNEFHVPANTPIKMLMTSNDVIHSFHVPVYRQKSDILPNRYTHIWFNSGEPGVYRVYCSEYCGKLHSNMYAKMVVESQEDYEAWLVKAGNWMVNEDGTMKSPLEIGELTYTRRSCKTCHSIDGRAGTGPTFAGLFGLERTIKDKEQGDITVIADENYISQSIWEPHSQLVEGYGEQMTIYSPKLPEAQVNGIIAYLKTLKDVPRID